VIKKIPLCVLPRLLPLPFLSFPLPSSTQGTHIDTVLYLCAYFAAEGEVMCFGRGGDGLLGSETTKLTVPSPLNIKTAQTDDTRIVAVACGHTHSLALAEDGRVLEWGKFTASERVVPTPTIASLANIAKVACGDEWSAAIDGMGKTTTTATAAIIIRHTCPRRVCNFSCVYGLID
jgi:alpha-tubulin suppressor-like RCC1 family protein